MSTVTYAVRQQMNELIDSLDYPSARKVNLVDAAAVEGFIEEYSDRSEARQAVLALYEVLAATHGHAWSNDEFRAAYVRWADINLARYQNT